MSVARKWGTGVLCLIALHRMAVAQPMSDMRPPDERSVESKGASTNIPVTMGANTEVVDTPALPVIADAPVAVEQPLDPDKYICGPGDVFELNFWGQQNFRFRVAADLEGRAFISKVGFVAVGGKTLTAVRALVSKKVRANYRGLMFELVLVTPRTFLVHAVEYVKQPGSYKAHALERVSTVLGRAGGITGSRRRITIKRTTGELVTADLELYELTGDVSLNPFVLDGDIVRVPAPELVVAISGAVRRPGRYELVKTKDLAELVDMAGGFTSSVATTLPIRVVRRNERQQAAFLDVPFAGSKPGNATLVDDDQVIVRGAESLQRTVLLIGALPGADAIDKATSGRRLPYIEGDSVLSLLDRSGGITSSGDLRRAYISRMRPGAGSPEIIPVDLDALIVRRDFRADKAVMMNDTIVVPSMQYGVLVEGAVARAGFYPFNPQFGIAEYVAVAGGRTRTARDLDESRLIEPSGKIHNYRSNLKPSPGDAILIPERNFSRAEVVQLAVAGVGLILSGVAVTLAATR